MTFPNDPNPVQRRALNDKVSRKGRAFGAIIVLAAIIVIAAFIWIEKSRSASSTSAVPTAPVAHARSQSTGSAAPATGR